MGSVSSGEKGDNKSEKKIKIEGICSVVGILKIPKILHHVGGEEWRKCSREN